ncbi:malonyl CoA-acyl carrier protein transacylase precursor, putative [Plasmodium relictum]|uniref:Malonyl CoA-acyl carrier protein transacylase, putative n=1 Tax=Plasmodium relictum TaxID=85471 RepID=A0A1J1HE92_PLARL|nr:malonyl CoA-acyl carrier protein transacylase precursor, putative [Plasmodium relictum]CRH02369.1 malonyl CoA-acyl carrier protein transacylase precursor, putative [Plasmodium relictum]
MFLNYNLLLLLILKIIIWDSKKSDSFILKNKDGPVISLVDSKNKKNNNRRKLVKDTNSRYEVKDQIITSNENENYIKKKLKEFEKYRIEKYSSKYTFFFPGQGEQYISMGMSSYDSCKHAKEIYDCASKVLGYNLVEVIKNGPIEKLKDSEIAQPSIYTVSIAAYEKLKCENKIEAEKLNLCMGYSLGEYSALTCANSLPFEEGVYLTKERGKAMQNSAKLHEMTTIAIVGLTLDTIYKLIEDVNKEMKDDVFIVSYMTDKKFGLCGKPASMEYLNKLAKEKYKAVFTKKLQISGAFHSSYMFPAKESLEKVLKQTNFKKLSVPVISNVDGCAYDDPFIIKELLLLQLTSPIKINLCLQNILKNGYESGYELGPGSINTNLLRDISKKTKTVIPYI